MGNKGSRNMTVDQRNAEEMSRKIDEVLARSARSDRSKIKLLLLGAGESGKSTIFKQFQLIYGGGFSAEDRLEMKDAVHDMTLSGMQMLVAHADALGLAGGFSSNEREAADALRAVMSGTLITMDHADMIKTLWQSQPVQGAWDSRARFQVVDGSKLFFEDVERVAADGYVPSVDDILHLRVQTTGILELDVTIDNVIFKMVDVGGQRSERKKWIHCFDDVCAVMFVAALSEFNQVLREDDTANRMEEALKLFEEISETRYFMHTPMILFLNKSDLFREKLERTNIRDEPIFADYSGRDQNYDDGVQYFETKFQDCKGGLDRKIYSHVTCATDTENVRFVFESSRNIVLGASLSESEFL